MSVPSDVLAAAALAAAGLSTRVLALVAMLPLPEAVALAAITACRRVEGVRAPRLRTQADLAALGAELVLVLQTAVRASEPRDAAAALYRLAEATRTACPASASPVLTRRYGLARALCAALEIAALGEAFLAEARTDFPDRSAAEAARTRIATALDAARDRLNATLGPVLLGSLEIAAQETGRHLIDLTTSLQPVVRVEGLRSAPSTALAWALYGDPARAPELVGRNACGTPLFMPATFEAVAPPREDD